MYTNNFQTVTDNEKYRVIDFRSDTLTVPTHEMRQAMFKAVVGDDDFEEDPTVKELEQKAAKLLGKEAALFVTSGTMANLLAIMIHCSSHDSQAISGNLAHTYLREQNGIAKLTGILLSPIENKHDGTFCLNELKNLIKNGNERERKPMLILVENTHNMCGGKVIPLEWLEGLGKLCKENELKLHMDGARVFNAAAYLNVPISRVVRDVDTVCFCLNKNLSCPIGSMLLGTKDFIKKARQNRKFLGGGMTQIGIMAAAGIIALDQVVPLLKNDHTRARKMAEAIFNLKSSNFSIDLDAVQTNIFMIHIRTGKIKSNDLIERFHIVSEQEIKDGILDVDSKGIIIKTRFQDHSFVRIILYLQINDILVNLAIKKILYVLKEFDQKLK